MVQIQIDISPEVDKFLKQVMKEQGCSRKNIALEYVLNKLVEKTK